MCAKYTHTHIEMYYLLLLLLTCLFIYKFKMFVHYLSYAEHIQTVCEHTHTYILKCKTGISRMNLFICIFFLMSQSPWLNFDFFDLLVIVTMMACKSVRCCTAVLESFFFFYIIWFM